MSDTYQAVYDAVRSRISHCDIGSAVESAIREAQISWHVERASIAITEAVSSAAAAHATPSAVYRPSLSIDGNQWCALYGDDLQRGVAGFGGSPAEAMQDFHNNWTAALSSRSPNTKPADLLRDMGFPEIRK